jgi:hypothetical protein
MYRGVLFVGLAVAFSAAGCAQMETAKFRAHQGQEALVRDGNPALLSRRPASLVMVRPASRQFQAGRRPSYVVAIYNLTRAPLQFAVANLSVGQIHDGQIDRPLRVYTFEDLQTEERNRQIAAAILVGVAAGANAAAASQAGYYHSNATVYSPGGVRNVSISGYSPTAAAIAQSNAAAQNDAMIASVVERGQQNMAMLERNVIKDNTLLPGEWYGGLVVFDPPEGEGEKTYQITVQVGSDTHHIEVAQNRVSS